PAISDRVRRVLATAKVAEDRDPQGRLGLRTVPRRLAEVQRHFRSAKREGSGHGGVSERTGRPRDSCYSESPPIASVNISRSLHLRAWKSPLRAITIHPVADPFSRRGAACSPFPARRWGAGSPCSPTSPSPSRPTWATAARSPCATCSAA